MSEQELNSILDEIKNRGKNEMEAEVNESDINFDFNSAVPRQSEREAKDDEVLPSQESISVPEEEASIIKEEPTEVEPISYEDEYAEEPVEKKPVNKKAIIIALVAAIIVAIVVAVVVAVSAKSKAPEPETTIPAATSTTEAEAPVVDAIRNPLTGEADYNEKAVGRRPIAVVVENEYSVESVRPQWGLNKADIVLEGESEYSTRLLLFFADYTNVPEQVGSARSARPPFIRFSELFDAVFIHAGFSHSKGNYVGANTVFEEDNVDHINLLKLSEGGKYFGRDKSRTSTVEHTGYLNGKNVPELLKEKNIKTKFDPTKYTQLSFNDEVVNLSDTPATSIEFKWTGAGGNCPKVGHFSYNEETKKYTTTDFDSSYGKSNVEWENLVFLLDQTSYIVKENYKGNQTETYCDYALSGGKGTVVSNGTAIEITWGVDNKKLWMKDANGNEVKLNAGKTYIGYGSENKGGYVSIKDAE